MFDKILGKLGLDGEDYYDDVDDEEIYDDNDLKHGTAGILTLCDQLTTKIDTYLEQTESEE